MEPQARAREAAAAAAAARGGDVPVLTGPPKLRAPPPRVEAQKTLPTKSAKEIFTEWDKDGNGLIDFAEFTEVEMWKVSPVVTSVAEVNTVCADVTVTQVNTVCADY